MTKCNHCGLIVCKTSTCATIDKTRKELYAAQNFSAKLVTHLDYVFSGLSSFSDHLAKRGDRLDTHMRYVLLLFLFFILLIIVC